MIRRNYYNQSAPVHYSSWSCTLLVGCTVAVARGVGKTGVRCYSSDIVASGHRAHTFYHSYASSVACCSFILVTASGANDCPVAAIAAQPIGRVTGSHIKQLY